MVLICKRFFDNLSLCTSYWKGSLRVTLDYDYDVILVCLVQSQLNLHVYLMKIISFSSIFRWRFLDHNLNIQCTKKIVTTEDLFEPDEDFIAKIGFKDLHRKNWVETKRNSDILWFYRKKKWNCFEWILQQKINKTKSRKWFMVFL